jgi:hypothetical protein
MWTRLKTENTLNINHTQVPLQKLTLQIKSKPGMFHRSSPQMARCWPPVALRRTFGSPSVFCRWALSTGHAGFLLWIPRFTPKADRVEFVVVNVHCGFPLSVTVLSPRGSKMVQLEVTSPICTAEERLTVQCILKVTVTGVYKNTQNK